MASPKQAGRKRTAISVPFRFGVPDHRRERAPLLLGEVPVKSSEAFYAAIVRAIIR